MALAGQASVPDAGPKAQSLLAKITALKGIVQVRDTDDQPWRPAAVGMELNEGAEFRTGPRSAVQFVIPPDQTITLDRLGTIKVLQAVKDAGKVTTALGMKYGRTRYDIQAADLEHDSTIRSPGSTLAIRGTDVTFEDMSPFPPNAVSREGRALFRTASRQFVAFGGTQRAAVGAKDASPAETAIKQTVADPQSIFGGRTDKEQALVLTLPSFGGTDLAATGIEVIQQQAAEQSAEPFVPPAIELVPTDLLIELVWSGSPQSDINLKVAFADEVVQLGSGVSPTGGRHLGNGVADAAGNGREAIRWSPSHPVGVYQITAFGDENSGLIDRGSLFVTQDPDGTAPVRIAEFLDIQPPENQDFITVRAVVPSPTPAQPPASSSPTRTTTVAGARRALRPAHDAPAARNGDVGRVREHSRRQR